MWPNSMIEQTPSRHRAPHVRMTIVNRTLMQAAILAPTVRASVTPDVYRRDDDRVRRRCGWKRSAARRE